MLRQLHELSKEELIEVVQDYQEMVTELEDFARSLMTAKSYMAGDAIHAILYKERPGWKIHAGDKREEMEGPDSSPVS